MGFFWHPRFLGALGSSRQFHWGRLSEWASWSEGILHYMSWYWALLFIRKLAHKQHPVINTSGRVRMLLSPKRVWNLSIGCVNWISENVTNGLKGNKGFILPNGSFWLWKRIRQGRAMTWLICITSWHAWKQSYYKAQLVMSTEILLHVTMDKLPQSTPNNFLWMSKTNKNLLLPWRAAKNRARQDFKTQLKEHSCESLVYLFQAKELPLPNKPPAIPTDISS